MADDKGQACCILGVCCAADSVERRSALAKKIHTEVGVTEQAAGAVADWVIENFDLAPKGTLHGYASAIAEMVRRHEKI